MRRARKGPPREGGPPEPPGWLLEARGNARPRGMIVGAGVGRPHRATELGLRSLRPRSLASKEAGLFLLCFDQNYTRRDQEGAQAFSCQTAGGEVFASQLRKKQRKKNTEGEDKESGR